WRNPREDLADLLVGNGRALRSAQRREHFRRRRPVLGMSDQREVNSPVIGKGYTGSCAIHVSVTSPGRPSASSVFRYCCSDAPRSCEALRLTSNSAGLTQLNWQTSQ